MKRILLNSVMLGVSLLINGFVYGQNTCLENNTTVGIENKHCRIIFDRNTGSLISLVNLTSQDNYLKASLHDKGMPFRVYRDFTKEYEFEDDHLLISRSVLK